MMLSKIGSLLALASTAFAANSFAGSNLYYAAGLSSSQQDTLFSGMKSGKFCSFIFVAVVYSSIVKPA
jgi:hypothetical protein